MIKRFVKNVSAASAIVPDLSSVIDGSFKLRLRNMRLRKGSTQKVMVTYDNQIIFRMQTMYNFRRIKHTDQIGVNYWASAKHDPNRTMAPVSFYALLEGDVKPMQHQQAILDGTIEGPQTTWGQEIDCLNTFVASSSRQKIVSQYITLPNGSTRAVTPFSKTYKFEVPQESSWQSQEDIEESFNNDDLEKEWQQIVSEEKQEVCQTQESQVTKAKKARKKKSRKPSTEIQEGSADLIEFSEGSNRNNRRKANSKKQLVTA